MKQTGLTELYAMQMEASLIKCAAYPAAASDKSGSYARQKPHNRIISQIIDFLQLKGWQAENIKTTGTLRDNRKIVVDVVGISKVVGSKKWTYGKSTEGSADISATIKGRSVKIELKTGKDYQKDDQITYQHSIEQSGGIYFLTYDFQSFWEWYYSIIDTL